MMFRALLGVVAGDAGVVGAGMIRDEGWMAGAMWRVGVAWAGEMLLIVVSGSSG